MADPLRRRVLIHCFESRGRQASKQASKQANVDVCTIFAKLDVPSECHLIYPRWKYCTYVRRLFPSSAFPFPLFFPPAANKLPFTHFRKLDSAKCFIFPPSHTRVHYFPPVDSGLSPDSTERTSLGRVTKRCWYKTLEVSKVMNVVRN